MMVRTQIRVMNEVDKEQFINDFSLTSKCVVFAVFGVVFVRQLIFLDIG